MSSQLFSSLASPHGREFIFQDGIYPDPAPGGYNGRRFHENMVSMQLIMNAAQQGPSPVASLNLQMSSPFPMIGMKEMFRLHMHRGNVWSMVK